jgi:uncharacterized membrane protein
MLSYWFPAPVSYWWPLAFAIGFAVIAVIAVYATLRRREEEPRANTIATLYGVGFGLAAVTELMMYLDVAFGWSLAAAFSIATGVATFFAVAAVVVAVLAIGIAAVMQFREESTYQAAHGYAR